MIKIYYLYIRESIGRRRFSFLVNLLVFIFAYFAIFMFMFPFYIDIIFISAAMFGIYKNKKTEIILASCSILILITVGVAAYEMITPYDNSKIYSNPEDRYLSEYDMHAFKPDIDAIFPMPYGDLAEYQGFPVSLRQPRLIHFKTDRFGFRNDASYRGQPLILAGDHFISGAGNDQKDILVNVLRDKYKLYTYSLAMPGSVQQRFDMCLDFQRYTHSKASIIMFMFEGGDFVASGQIESILSKIIRLWLYKYQRVKYKTAEYISNRFNLRVFQLISSFWIQLDSEIIDASNPLVTIAMARNNKIAFDSAHINKSTCGDLMMQLPEPHPSVLKKIKAVYFIPTKYRIYCPLLSIPQDVVLHEPSPALKSLNEFFLPKGIPVYDLTPTLRKAAAASLQNGELIYWADDTHWNALGTAATAEFIANSLNQVGKQ
jgi:hypothetical protein